MKLLLDENVPRQLKKDIVGHKVFTVREKRWNGKLNGELLQLMLDDQFEGLITTDRSLQHQQNFEYYPVPIIVLRVYRNTYEYLQPLVPRLNKLLETTLPSGPTVISALKS